MKKDAMHRMLCQLARGKCPDASALGVSGEEYAKLVSDASERGYISGAYVSFCDNANSGNLLASAELTDKGREEAAECSLFRRIARRRSY